MSIYLRSWNKNCACSVLQRDSFFSHREQNNARYLASDIKKIREMDESAEFITANDVFETRLYSIPHSSTGDNDETLNEITWGFESSVSPRLVLTDGQDDPVQVFMTEARHGRLGKYRCQNQNKKRSDNTGKKRDKCSGKKCSLGRRRFKRENQVNTERNGGKAKATEVSRNKETANSKRSSVASVKKKQGKKLQIMKTGACGEGDGAGMLRETKTRREIKKETQGKKSNDKAIKKSEQYALSCDSAVCLLDHGPDLSNGTRSEASLVCKRDSWIWFSPETRPSMENFTSRQRKFQSQDPRVAKLAAEIRRQEHLNRDIEREAESLIESSSMSTGPHQAFPLLAMMQGNRPSTRRPISHIRGRKRSRPSPYSRPSQNNNGRCLQRYLHPNLKEALDLTGKELKMPEQRTAPKDEAHSKLPQKLKGRGIHTFKNTSPKRCKMRELGLDMGSNKTTSPHGRKLIRHFWDEEVRTNDSLPSSSLSKRSPSHLTTSMVSSSPQPIEYYNSPDAAKIKRVKNTGCYSPLYDNSTLVNSKSTVSTSSDKESNIAESSHLGIKTTTGITINTDECQTDTLPQASTSELDIHGNTNKSPRFRPDSRLAIERKRKNALLSSYDSESESMGREKSARESSTKHNFILKEVNNAVHRILFDTEQSSSSHSPIHNQVVKRNLATDKYTCSTRYSRSSLSRLPCRVTQKNQNVPLRKTTPEADDNVMESQVADSHQNLPRQISEASTPNSPMEKQKPKTSRINIYARDYYLGKRFARKDEQKNWNETGNCKCKSTSPSFISLLKSQATPVNKPSIIPSGAKTQNDTKKGPSNIPSPLKSRLPLPKQINAHSTYSANKLSPVCNKSQSLISQPQASQSMETKEDQTKQFPLKISVHADQTSNHGKEVTYSASGPASSEHEKILTYSDSYWAKQARVRKSVSLVEGPITISKSHQNFVISRKSSNQSLVKSPNQSHVKSPKQSQEVPGSVLKLRSKVPVTQEPSESCAVSPFKFSTVPISLGPTSMFTPLEPIAVCCSSLVSNVNVASKSTNNSSSNFPFRRDSNFTNPCKANLSIPSAKVYFVSQTQGVPINTYHHGNGQGDLGSSNNVHIDVFDHYFPWRKISTKGAFRKTRHFDVDEDQINYTRNCYSDYIPASAKTVDFEERVEKTLENLHSGSKISGFEIDLPRLKTADEANSISELTGPKSEIFSAPSGDSATLDFPHIKTAKSRKRESPQDVHLANDASIIASTLLLPTTSSDEEDTVEVEKDKRGEIAEVASANSTWNTFVTKPEVCSRNPEHLLFVSNAIYKHSSNPDSGYDESTSEKLTDQLKESNLCLRDQPCQDPIVHKTDHNVGRHCPEHTCSQRDVKTSESLSSSDMSHNSEDLTCTSETSNDWGHDHEPTPLASDLSHCDTIHSLSHNDLLKTDWNFRDTKFQRNKSHGYEKFHENSLEYPDSSRAQVDCPAANASIQQDYSNSFLNRSAVGNENSITANAENACSCHNVSLVENNQMAIQGNDTYHTRLEDIAGNHIKNAKAKDQEFSHSKFQMTDSFTYSDSSDVVFPANDPASTSSLSFTFQTNSHSSCLDIEDCILEISNKTSPIQPEGYQQPGSNLGTPKATLQRLPNTDQAPLDVSESISTVADIKILSSLESLQLSNCNSDMSRSTSFDASGWSKYDSNESKSPTHFTSFTAGIVSKITTETARQLTQDEQLKKTHTEEENSVTAHETHYIEQTSKESEVIDSSACNVILPPTSSDEETDEENDPEENKPSYNCRAHKEDMKSQKISNSLPFSRSECHISNPRKQLLLENEISSPTRLKPASQTCPKGSSSITSHAKNRVIIPKRSVQFSELLKRF